MSYSEIPNTCDFCDKALGKPWFQLKSCRHDGLEIRGEYMIKVCEPCYTPVHQAIKTAVHERIKQLFFEAIAKFRQDKVEKI